MHIFQAIRNVSQLDSISVRPLRDQVTTYKLGAVYMSIPLNEFVDVSIFHPLGNHRKPVFTHRHPKQWYDVWMPKVFPGDSLSAEPL